MPANVEKEIDGLSNASLLVVVQNQGAAESVDLVISAVIPVPGGGEVEASLGAFSVAAPSGLEPPTRAVALAVAPSVSRWKVRASSVAPSSNIGLLLASGLPNAMPIVGVQGTGLVIPLVTSPPVQSNQPQSYLWVALNGNNTDAQRGRIDKPFQTIQAALNAAQGGDCIIIAPGVYNEAVSIPSGLFLVTLRAMTQDGSSTQIQSPTNGIEFSPQGSQVVNLEGLGIFGNNAGVRAVGVNPDLNLATLSIRGCSLNGGSAGLIAQNLSDLNLSGGLHGQLSVLDCNNAYLTGGARISLLELGVSAAPPISLNHASYILGGGLEVSQLEQTGGARVICDKSVRVVSLNAALSTSGPFVGALVFPAYADNAQVTTEDNSDLQLDGATMDIFSWQHNGGANLTAKARGATLTQVFQNTTGGDAILDNEGGAIGYNVSLFGPNCYALRDGGAAVSLAVPSGGASFAFGVDLLGPPYPPTAQVAYSVTPRASTTAVDQIVYADAPSGPSGAALGNDSAGPVTVDLTWELVA